MADAPAAQPTRVVHRVLHVTQPTTEGTAEVVRNLVTWGLAEGQDVTVAGPSGGGLADWVVESGGSWIDLPLTRSTSWRDYRLVRALRQLLPRFDVVHLHSSKAGAVGRLAVAGTSVRPRIVFVPHGWSWLVGGRAATAYRLFERWAAGRCDVIVAVSDQERDAGFAVLGATAPITVIENGVDASVFSPDGEVASRAGSPLIVCVGRLTRQKGQDLAVRALARMTRADAHLRLVGSGPAEAELRDLANTLGVGSRVEFLGQAVPAPHLRAADVVVLPSRWEGLALALLESMSVGCAVVASDRGSCSALGDAGVVVPLGDETGFVAGLAQVLDELVADPCRRAALRSRSRDRAVRAYTLDRTRSGYRRLWDELQAAPARPDLAVRPGAR